MSGSNELIIRPATEADRAFALGLVPRLRSFGTVPLRSIEDLDGAERRTLEAAFDELPADAVLLVAEHPRDGALGFAHAVTATDYFTREAHGHLAIIAVAEAGEGRGVGRALMAAIEQWAAGRGYRLLTLSVFEANTRARDLYERNGFGVDMLRCIKELTGSSEKEKVMPKLAAAAAERWGTKEMPEAENHCADCVFYVRLNGSGPFLDYGACSSPRSFFDGRVVSFRSGCASFKPRP